MVRKLVICTAVAAVGISGPAWGASPLDEYQQTGHITPCRYSSGQLQGSVPNDVAQYAPEYQSALQAAARERARGCGSAASSGSTGRSAGAGGTGGGDAGSSAAAGGVPTAAAAATARKARDRTRARRRARARLAAATVLPANLSSDARVSDGTLMLALLPILLLLLILTGALRWRGALERRVGLGLRPARTPNGAIILPPPNGEVSGNGNGHGNGEVPSAEAPTEEVAALREDRARNV